MKTVAHLRGLCILNVKILPITKWGKILPTIVLISYLYWWVLKSAIACFKFINLLLLSRLILWTKHLIKDHFLLKDNLPFMIKKIILASLSMGLIASGNAFYSPPGLYWQSCFDMKWETPTTFSAICRSDSGSFLPSSLRNADRCSEIENINGVLTCIGEFR